MTERKREREERERERERERKIVCVCEREREREITRCLMITQQLLSKNHYCFTWNTSYYMYNRCTSQVANAIGQVGKPVNQVYPLCYLTAWRQYLTRDPHLLLEYKVHNFHIW